MSYLFNSETMTLADFSMHHHDGYFYEDGIILKFIPSIIL